MNKRTKNLFKMSAVGCVAIMGVSAASLPVHAMVPTQVTANVSAALPSRHQLLLALKCKKKYLTQQVNT